MKAKSEFCMVSRQNTSTHATENISLSCCSFFFSFVILILFRTNRLLKPTAFFFYLFFFPKDICSENPAQPGNILHTSPVDKAMIWGWK